MRFLGKYFELRENPAMRACSVDEILKFDSNGVSVVPANLRFMCEVGVALQRLTPRERFAVCKYFWATVVYTQAVTLRGQAANGELRAGSHTPSRKKCKQLFQLFDEYSKKAAMQIDSLGKNRHFRNGITYLGQHLAKAFYHAPLI